MKKILTACILLACTLSLSAQDTLKTQWGVKAGMSLSTITTSKTGTAETTSNLDGFTGGGFAVFHLSKSFGLQGQLTYNSSGTMASFSGFSSGIKISLSYISLAVLPKVTFTNSRFSLFAGPQIGFLTSATGTSGGNSTDLKDGYNSTDISALLGFDYTFKGGINLSWHYALGLSNIIKNPDPGQSAKNSGVSFTIGYLF